MKENEKKNPVEEEDEDTEIFTLEDEDGKEYKFESLGSLEHKGQIYYALVSAEENKNNSSDEYVILKSAVDENGEEILITIDDDDEFDEVADIIDDELNDIDYDPQN